MSTKRKARVAGEKSTHGGPPTQRAPSHRFPPHHFASRPPAPSPIKDGGGGIRGAWCDVKGGAMRRERGGCIPLRTPPLIIDERVLGGPPFQGGGSHEEGGRFQLPLDPVLAPPSFYLSSKDKRRSACLRGAASTRSFFYIIKKTFLLDPAAHPPPPPFPLPTTANSWQWGGGRQRGGIAPPRAARGGGAARTACRKAAPLGLFFPPGGGGMRANDAVCGGGSQGPEGGRFRGYSKIGTGEPYDGRLSRTVRRAAVNVRRRGRPYFFLWSTICCIC
nr:hypothetical protein [Morchella crassipes]